MPSGSKYKIKNYNCIVHVQYSYNFLFYIYYQKAWSGLVIFNLDCLYSTEFLFYIYYHKAGSGLVILN